MSTYKSSTKLAAAGSGLLAATAGVAVSSGVAALFTGVSSPIVAVGSHVIDLTPGALKDWAVKNLGTSDKPVLIGSVIVGLAIVAAVAGLIGLRRPRVAIGITAVLGLVALLAGVTDRATTAGPVLAVIPGLVALVVSVPAIAWLLGALSQREADSRPRILQSHPGDDTVTPFDRRKFLAVAMATSAVAVAGGTLNSGQFTVFAPVDDAFAKIPADTLAALSKPANAELLTKILTYHVVPGQLTPDEVTGSLDTAEGEKLKVTGSGDNIVSDGMSKVICGGVVTQNATVYLIDTVMMPPSLDK